MEYSTSIKKAYIFFITLLFISPSIVSAQSTNTTTGTQQTGQTTGTQTQQQQTADAPINQGFQKSENTAQTPGNLTSDIGGGAGSLVQCSIGALLGNIIQQSLSSLTGELVNKLGASLEQKVPVKNVTLEQAQTGVTIPGTSVPIFPSWDAIGFCLINTIIDYIGQATVEWINRGFPDGGPVFIQDPGSFVQGIADYESGKFIEEISDGILCSPFSLQLTSNLASNRLRTIRQKTQCTFQNQVQNMERFLSGQSFSYNDWLAVTQNPANNPYGSQYLLNSEMQLRIINSQGKQIKLLDWGRGFLSFTDPETGKITTPGAIIEKQINNRLDNPNQRLLIADEFDEIVTALVNQLLRVAVNEITQIGNNN